jgi:molecular chaperone DnaJ
VELEVTLEQARDGATVPVDIDRLTVCDHCHGQRAEPGGKGKQRCVQCAGAGAVRVQAQSFFGTVVTQQVCPRCNGVGEVVIEPCTVCRGVGRTASAPRCRSGFPKGIDRGYRLRVPREGNAGLDGGHAGDLYVYLELAPHEHLTPRGRRPVLRAPRRLRAGGPGVGVRGAHARRRRGARGAARHALRHRGAAARQGHAAAPPGGHRRPGRAHRRRHAAAAHAQGARAADAYAEEMGEAIEPHETLLERVKGLFGKRRKPREGEQEPAPRN